MFVLITAQACYFFLIIFLKILPPIKNTRAFFYNAQNVLKDAGYTTPTTALFTKKKKAWTNYPPAKN